MSGPVILNVGSGHHNMPNAVNIDLYDDRADLKADASDLHMYGDNSVDVVVASQILEHFTFEGGKKALREWFRVLKPGGELVVSVPDMGAVVPLFADMPDGLQAGTMYFFYGAQGGPGDVHMSGYTQYSLHKLLNEIGFDVIWHDKNTPRRPTPSMRFVGKKP